MLYRIGVTQRRELLEDLRTEQAVRDHVATQLHDDQSALDLAVGGLANFLGLDVSALPAPVLRSIRISAEVMVDGQPSPQHIDIDLAVPAPLPAPVEEQDAEKQPSTALSGSFAHGQVIQRAAYADAVRALSTVDFSRLTAVSSALRSIQQVGTPAYQAQIASVMHAIANASTHSTGGALASTPRPLKDALLELFSSNPDDWYTMQEVMAELKDRGVEAEYEEVRKTLHGLHAIYPQLEKPTRKSWVWRAPPDDHDVETDDVAPDDHDVETDDGTPDDYMAGESDAPTISDYVNPSEYFDSDGLTTSDIPLEADRD